MEIYEFHKNSIEKVRISVNKYQGKKYLDIRVMYDAGKKGQQEWRFSPKGVTVSLDLFSELEKGIELVRAAESRFTGKRT